MSHNPSLVAKVENMALTFFFLVFKSRPPYQVEKGNGCAEVGVSEEGVYCKVVFL